MPRAAALLDVAQISEISGIVSADTFIRPTYAGNAMATVNSSDLLKAITVRATAFDAAAEEVLGERLREAGVPLRRELAHGQRDEAVLHKAGQLRLGEQPRPWPAALAIGLGLGQGLGLG